MLEILHLRKLNRYAKNLNSNLYQHEYPNAKLMNILLLGYTLV